MSDVPEVDLDEILTFTKQLIKNVYWVKQELSVKPDKEHHAVAINYVDLKERRDFFLQELVATVTSWVYSKKKFRAILDDRLAMTNGDEGNAAAFISNLASSKFRKGHPQGQMGELILFNFIQAFFQAVPLLRKQRITTSTGHERFGADAIHYKNEEDEQVFILGESKCYKSDYKFKQAFEVSIESIGDTFKKLDSELNLYIYDDFIEDELRDVAIKYKDGDLGKVKFELVCLVIYNETKKINGEDEEKIKSQILEVIHNRCMSIDESVFNGLEKNLVPRLNYIIFPVWELDDLLSKFMKMVGA